MDRNTLVVYTKLSGKEFHRQVAMDRVIASHSLGSVTVSMLRYGMATSLGLNPAVGAVLPIFSDTGC